jgi:hypothetical protein
LAALREAPLLRRLTLDLSRTFVGDAGTAALAALAEAPGKPFRCVLYCLGLPPD